MSPSPASSTAFITLMRNFAVHSGMPALSDEDAFGAEFEVGAHRCRVLPHPGRDDRLLLEVDVQPVGPDGAELEPAIALLLLRLNGDARFEHDWSICLDNRHHLILSAWREIAQTPPGELEALLVEGIERAESLSAALRAPIPDAPVQAVSPFDSRGSLRG